MSAAADVAGAAYSPWMGEEGHWPLPWLENAWPGASALQGHALLLQGPGGVGQFELALLLAQAGLCEQPQPVAASTGVRRPCGRCGSCHLLTQGAHPDFLLSVPAAMRERLPLGPPSAEEPAEAAAGSSTDSAGGKAAGREIRVVDIRRGIDWSHRTSSRARAKVWVIHPAQRLNAVAANALLKTLEEPPGPLRLILTCEDPQALLPTVRSRCQRLSLPIPPTPIARSWLEGRGLAGADVLLQAAGGRALDALDMARDGVSAVAWAALPTAVAQGRVDVFSGWPLSRVVDALQRLCLDLMALHQGVPPQYFPAQSLPVQASEASAAALPALSSWWTALQRVSRHDEHPWNLGLLLESLVLQGKACWPLKRAARAGTAGLSTAGVSGLRST